MKRWVTKRGKFTIEITVRVTDLNYGNHVGHQTYFSYFHEARVAYLKRFGASELDIGGFGLIVSSADCRYKQQLRLGDELIVSCRAAHITPKMIKFEYQILRNRELCATGATTTLCFDYSRERVVSFPETFRERVDCFERGLSSSRIHSN